MASDPEVTAIVTIYSHSTAFGCRGGFQAGKKAMNPRLFVQVEIRGVESVKARLVAGRVSETLEDHPDFLKPAARAYFQNTP
jgi:hypothetical protein